MEPLRVLIADDSSDSAMMMKVLIQLAGHVVEVAGDGLAAVELALKFQPHVAVIDLSMPKLDGYEVARRLRADSRCAEMKLVANSGYGDAETLAQVYAAGFDEHFLKPASTPAIMAFLAKEAKRLAGGE